MKVLTTCACPAELIWEYQERYFIMAKREHIFSDKSEIRQNSGQGKLGPTAPFFVILCFKKWHQQCFIHITRWVFIVG